MSLAGEATADGQAVQVFAPDVDVGHRGTPGVEGRAAQAGDTGDSAAETVRVRESARSAEAAAEVSAASPNATSSSGICQRVEVGQA